MARAMGLSRIYGLAGHRATPQAWLSPPSLGGLRETNGEPAVIGALWVAVLGDAAKQLNQEGFGDSKRWRDVLSPLND